MQIYSSVGSWARFAAGSAASHCAGSLAGLRGRALHDSAVDAEVAHGKMRTGEITATAAVVNRHPAHPLGRVDHSAMGLVGPFERAPVDAAGHGAEAGGAYGLAVAYRRPCAVRAEFLTHVEGRLATVVVIAPAAPRGAAIVAGPGLGVQRSRTSAIAVRFDPVHLNAPWRAARAVAVIALSEAAADVRGRDGVDVCIHANGDSREVDIILNLHSSWRGRGRGRTCRLVGVRVQCVQCVRARGRT